MPVYEFAIQTRREVTVGIAQHLGLDKPSPPKEQRGGEEEDWRKIFRMSLKHRDERGHEHEVAEWDERDLYAKGISMDTIVHGVELAACRDAAYQPYGEVVYVLAFHGKDHPNRSRFMFKIQGGQEVQNLAMTHGMMGGRDSVQSASLAERLIPDILKYVDGKEERLTRRETHFLDTIVKQLAARDEVIQQYTDREMNLIEIERNADDHAYDRNKKRKEEEADEKRKQELMDLVKEHGPKAMPYVIGALKRLSGGGVSQEASQGPGYGEGYGAGYGGYGDWYGTPPKPEERRQSREQREKPEARGKSSNGYASSNGNASSNGHGREGSEEAEGGAQDVETGEKEKSSEGDEPSMLDQLKLRVAFDTSRFVMLAQGRNKLEAIRGALSESQWDVFMEIKKAVESEDLDSNESVQKVADLALQFGMVVKLDPATGEKLLEALDNITRLALLELSKLLAFYYEHLQK
jgi:hypothetical protein